MGLNKTSTILILFLATLVIISCAKNPGFNHAALGLNGYKILVVNSNTTAPVSYTVTMYDENGTYLGIVADYTNIGAPIRGIAAIDPLNFIVSLENVDRLDKINIFGTKSLFASDTNFNGTIFDVEKAPDGSFFVIEGNTIERFDSHGVRYNSGVTPYISASLVTGGTTCTLNVPRKLTILSNGNLAVTNTGNDIVNVYNISGPAATCVSINNGSGAFDPVAILAHSDGNTYVATNLAANSRVLRFTGTMTGAATVIWPTNLSVISTPTAMAEMPDGSILVASDATDTIERIDTSGQMVSTSSFIRNPYTGSVTDIIVVGGE